MRTVRILLFFLVTSIIAAWCAGSSQGQETSGDPALLVLEGDLQPASESATQGGFPSFYTKVAEQGADPLRPSVDLDRYGKAHITYWDTAQATLKHAYESLTTGWTVREIDLGSTPGGVSMAVDQDRYGHVAYADSSASKLLYAYQDAGGWHEGNVVDGSASPGQVALELDGDGTPHIAYWDSAQNALKYAFGSRSDWKVESIEGGSSPCRISLAFDRDDQPYIAYYDAAQDALKYIRRKANGWTQVRTLASNLGGNGMCIALSLAADEHENAHLCYHTNESGSVALRYKEYDDAGLHRNLLLAQISDLRLDCSIQVDDQNYPHVLFHSNQKVLYAKEDSAGWVAAVIPPPSPGPITGEQNALALEDDGDVHAAFSYREAGTGSTHLMYAHGENSFPTLRGDISCEWGDSDCNPCVQNVEGAFSRIRDHGDILGFHIGDHPDPPWQVWWPNPHGHWQGVQRLMPGDGRYLVVTRDEINYSGVDWSGFTVVEMGSRSAGPQRLRSNRLSRTSGANDTAPPLTDQIIHTEKISEDEVHPGGIQTLGNYLVVGAGHEIHAYDLENPKAPDHLGRILYRPYRSGSSTSLAKLQDGRYLLVISSSDANPIDFYISSQPDSFSGFLRLDQWDGSELIGGSWEAYQSLNLVTDCSYGDLYLIGTHNTADPWPFEDDWADLFKIEQKQEPGAKDVQITKVGNLHVYCGFRDETHCNLDAAAGVYVDQDHRLYLYSTEHGNEGPEGSTPSGSVKFMEFRPVPDASCSPGMDISNAWVELYRDTDFQDRSLMIDYRDAHLRNYSNYDQVEDFEDKASSARWCLPEGYSYYLWQDKSPCGGKALALTGKGEMRQVRNLKDVDFNDRASCSGFVQDKPQSRIINAGIRTVIEYRRPLPPGAQAQGPDQDASTTVDVPAGAVDRTIELTYRPVFPQDHPTAPLVSPGYAFDLDVTIDGAPVEAFGFLQPVDLTIRYSPEDLGSVEEASLALWVWDEDEGVWSDAASTCDPVSNYERAPAENRLSVAVCRSGDFVMVGVPEELYKKVLVEEAHDNLLSLDWQRAQQIEDSISWNDDPAWFYLDRLRQNLANEFLLARDPGSRLTAGYLARYDAVLIPQYRAAFTQAEVDALHQYVAGGGGLVLLGDGGFDPPNPQLAERYGIEFVWNGIFKYPYNPAQGLDGDLEIVNFAEHPAVAGVARYYQNWGQSLRLDDGTDWLATTAGTPAWRDDNDDGGYDIGEGNVFDVVAAFDTGCGRVAAVADNSFSDGALLGPWACNEDLLRALLRWVSAGQPCTGGYAAHLPLVVGNR